MNDAQEQGQERDSAAIEAAPPAGQEGEDTQGFGHRPGNARSIWPWNDYTGYHHDQRFGGFQTATDGPRTYIGAFPMYRAQLPPPAQPGMGLR